MRQKWAEPEMGGTEMGEAEMGAHDRMNRTGYRGPAWHEESCQTDNLRRT